MILIVHSKKQKEIFFHQIGKNIIERNSKFGIYLHILTNFFKSKIVKKNKLFILTSTKKGIFC